MDIKRFYQNSKLVYSSKKVPAQKIALEYISVSAGDFAPIVPRNAGIVVDVIAD
jgi:hypothetical protein